MIVVFSMPKIIGCALYRWRSVGTANGTLDTETSPSIDHSEGKLFPIKMSLHATFTGSCRYASLRRTAEGLYSSFLPLPDSPAGDAFTSMRKPSSRVIPAEFGLQSVAWKLTLF